MSTSSIPNNDYHGGQSRLSRASSTTKNEYFVPGYGISRQVIVEHIQLFLGPGSSARPYSYLGREGFLILTSGKPLTKSQIEDLRQLSVEYEQKIAKRMIPMNGNEPEDAFLNRPIQVQQGQRRSRNLHSRNESVPSPVHP
ncbi:hypothetical protein MMC31_004413 [Peltigera leucophlebia]|nr:hypothetical protein [Peltigera leucophlebia]